MTFGVDIGTTSVAAVAVSEAGGLVASASVVHRADVEGLGDGVHEQDPSMLLDAVRDALHKVGAGDGALIGWTGQMHGVVGVDRELRPVTRFVTWRDARRFGGSVMEGWAREGRKDIFKCLSSCGLAVAAFTGRCETDETFLHSWHLEGREFPESWLPEFVPGSMVGDNQSGVFAAQCLVPGSAVVNIGTSGQLSVVGEGIGGERRPYFGGVMRCRASLIGGQALAALRQRLGVTWDELNAMEDIPEVANCLGVIVDDLAAGIEIPAEAPIVGVGNALRFNPALRRAVERRFSRPCFVPDVPEMAAYGAALARRRRRPRSCAGPDDSGRSQGRSRV